MVKIGTIDLMNGKTKTMYASEKGKVHTKGLNGNKNYITPIVAEAVGGMRKLKKKIKNMMK